ncbi:Arrestin domain-containing protein 3 [Anthophora quadrimaculata]
MSLTTFRFNFDRYGATYMPGDTVTGTIILEITREKNIRGITLSAKGEASVDWSESETQHDSMQNTSNTTSVRYHNSEKYFHFKYNILGSHNSDHKMTIQSGFYTYPFSFQLPHSIPSSFEHTYGYVRYTVKATIDRPWKFNHECKAAFTVISSLNLNEYRQDCIGIDDESTHDFCCCCICFFKRDSLNLRVRAPSSGYVPGQIINSIIDHTLSSNAVRIASFSIILEQEIEFRATTKTKTVRSDIKTTKHSGPFPVGGQLNLELLIPPLPPSKLKYCSIIDLNYHLKIQAQVSGPHCNVVKKYPLLIGTVPLYCPPSAPSPNPVDQGTAEIHMPMSEQPNASSSKDVLDISSTNYNIPPPSYEECISGTSTIKDKDESNYVFGANEQFSPRYPVFNYPTPSKMKH